MNTVLINCKSKKQSLAESNLQLLVHDYIYRWGNSYEIEDRWWGDKTLSWKEEIGRASCRERVLMPV